MLDYDNFFEKFQKKNFHQKKNLKKNLKKI